MKHLLVEGPLEDGVALLPSTQVRHRLRRVLRKRAGDTVAVTDGGGRRVDCTWNGMALEPCGAIETVAADRPTVEIAAGMLKGVRWEWLLEKCAEAGADRIVPLVMAHNVVRVPHKIAERLQRWQGVADAATEQCGRCWRTEVAEPVRLDLWLGQSEGLLLFCDERVSNPTIAAQYARSERPQSVRLVIGPEGGFDDEERQSLHRSSAQAIALAPWVLRSETAALAATLAIRAAGRDA